MQLTEPLLDYLTARGVAPENLSLYGMTADLPAHDISSPFLISFEARPPTTAGAGALALARPKSGLGSMIFPLTYRLEIAAMPGAFTGTFMNALPDPLAEKDHRLRIYRYLTGRFSTFDEATQERKRLEQQGIISRIVPYIDGRRASATEIQQNRLRLTDLENFLKD